MIDDKPRQFSAQKVFLAGFLSAALLVAGAFLAWRNFEAPSSWAPMTANIFAPSTDVTVSADTITAPPAQAPAKLPTTSRVESSADKAMTAANELRRGNDVAAALLARQVLAGSQMHAFGFAPFNRFINHLTQGDDADYAAGLNRWVSHDPHSALAYLLRAKYDYDTAWVVRGPDADRAVTGVHMQAFYDGLSSAETDVKKSIELDPDNPWSYFLWLNIASVRDGGVRMDEVFRQGIARFPNYYELYRARLSHIASPQDKLDFVSRYAGATPESSPLKLLYLQLQVSQPRSSECRVTNLLTLIDCFLDEVSLPQAEKAQTGIEQAVALYKHTDPVEYSNALWPILENMEQRPDLSAILQKIADVMGSEIQLIHEPGHNNYVLDDMTARVWERLDNPANVDQKYHEALDDVARMPFADEESRSEALATIYDHMAWTARRTSQFAQVITYHDAANDAAGINHGGSQYLKCFALFKLNRYQEAIDECDQLIATHRAYPTRCITGPAHARG